MPARVLLVPLALTGEQEHLVEALPAQVAARARDHRPDALQALRARSARLRLGLARGARAGRGPGRGGRGDPQPPRARAEAPAPRASADAGWGCHAARRRAGLSRVEDPLAFAGPGPGAREPADGRRGERRRASLRRPRAAPLRPVRAGRGLGYGPGAPLLLFLADKAVGVTDRDGSGSAGTLSRELFAQAATLLRATGPRRASSPQLAQRVWASQHSS